MWHEEVRSWRHRSSGRSSIPSGTSTSRPQGLCHSRASRAPTSCTPFSGASPLDLPTRPSGVVEMEFRVLGPVEAIDEGRAIRLGGAQQRRLLGVLLADADRVVPVSRLVDAVWPDEEPP